MFIVDDILLFPLKSLVWIFRQIHSAVDEEMAQQADNIMEELRRIYMMLETGRISEEEFQARETELLDRLDRIQGKDDSPADAP